TPAEITPFLLGITPNETRLDGGTSHLVSGGFLTSADRLVFMHEETKVVIESSEFAEVNDNFIVFVMPDLSESFSTGDILALRAEKDVGAATLVSNTINAAIRVSFAGPPTITPDLDPNHGSAFGGKPVKFSGALFTSNSQVLFGTMPARQIVVVGPTELWAVPPALPVSAPAGGLALDSFDTRDDTSVDVAVFTQGGWAVLEDGYTFDPTGPTFESCSRDEVLSGETINIIVKGGNFVPGKTEITPILGEASNVVVHDFNTLSFDYTAPLGGAGEIGPDLDTFKIATNMGDPVSGCTIKIKLPPFLTDCESTYEANSSASPTTGVADGALIEVTVSGGNLEAGGKMWMERGGTAGTIPMTEVTGDFTGGGQWKRINGLEIVFTVPNIFSTDTPTLLEGNRNIGPVAIKYESPDGRVADLSGCFSYVPSFPEFEDYSFTVTNPAAPLTARPDKVTLGDVNQDGVIDVALLVRGDDSTWLPLQGPEAYILMADTFGESVDINGDGVTPDWAGSFTQQSIESDDVQIEHKTYGRGGRVLLENIDEDDELEVIIPASAHDGPNCARVLFADMQEDGTFDVVKIITPGGDDSIGGIAGFASGHFENTHEGVDIALILGSSSQSNRDVIILQSTSTVLDYKEVRTDVDSDINDYEVSYLAAGDFDGDGDDDLIWGQHRKGTHYPQYLPIVVAEIANGTVSSHGKLTNVTGGDCAAIAIVDCEDDEEESEFTAVEAVVLCENGAKGGLTGNETVESCIIVIENPLSKLADSYHLTGFIDSGRGLAAGDLNADGMDDLAVVSEPGKMVVFIGGADCAFTNGGRSWTSPIGAGQWSSRVEGIAIGDINRDGLGDVFVGDAGYEPEALIFWLNTSR
ncbi:MAG: FG-GAP repeat domain-containing protein, partial [Planctomycetota bacterium]